MTQEAIGYDGNGIRKGDRVQLHPATDLWMSGARYGTVTRVAKDGSDMLVRVDRHNRSYIVHSRNVRNASA